MRWSIRRYKGFVLRNYSEIIPTVTISATIASVIVHALLHHEFLFAFFVLALSIDASEDENIKHEQCAANGNHHRQHVRIVGGWHFRQRGTRLNVSSTS